MIRDIENNLIPCSWEIAFKNILDNLNGNNINYFFGPDVDANTVAAIKDLSELNLTN